MGWSRSLSREALESRHPAIKSQRAGALAEGASIALSRRHQPPKDAEVDDEGTQHTLTLSWAPTEPSVLRAWDDEEATEKGAEAVAIVSVEATRGFRVIHRAPRGSRVDYYLGEPGDELESAAVLEVAGTDEGSLSSLLDRKTEQATLNQDDLPKVVVVVWFREPRVMIREIDRSEP